MRHCASSTPAGGTRRLNQQFPKDLCEQLALAEAKAKAKAGAGTPIMGQMGDEPCLVAVYGPGPWVKKQHIHICSNGRRLVIHYFSNGRGMNVELKFK
jgi:hypothetical protein